MGRPADILLSYEVRRKGGRASDKNKRTRALCQCTRELVSVWLPVTLACSADHAITVSTCKQVPSVGVRGCAMRREKKNRRPSRGLSRAPAGDALG